MEKNKVNPGDNGVSPLEYGANLDAAGDGMAFGIVEAACHHLQDNFQRKVGVENTRRFHCRFCDTCIFYKVYGQVAVISIMEQILVTYSVAIRTLDRLICLVVLYGIISASSAISCSYFGKYRLLNILIVLPMPPFCILLATTSSNADWVTEASALQDSLAPQRRGWGQG